MYLETRDLGDMMDIYFAGWERGVKTTYYLHMKPRHTAEQSTVKVDKSQDADGTKRKGFGGFGGGAPAAVPASAAPASTATAEAPAPQSAPAPRKGFGFGGVGGAR